MPYFSPYLAAKAAFDALAVQYARELTRWGIETSIIVAGVLGQDDESIAQIASCADGASAAAYEAGPYAGFGAQVRQALQEIVPAEANAGAVAGAVAGVVDTPFGERPFRVHIDPSHDGADIAFGVIDRVREEMLHRVGLSDLLKPRHPV
jgi:NAD(P)-dependent dehydrogenase (short-subunit alcohol dehydrogenase family)